MMKRILALTLALLMMALLLPAQAEEAVPAAVYRIVLRTEAGDETLGSGVLFGTQNTLLTAKGCWAEGEMVAIGADGEHKVSFRGEVAGSQLILLGLQTDSAAQPLTVTQAEYLKSNDLYGVHADGAFAIHTATLSRSTVIDGRVEVLLSASEGLLPGAIMLGADGGLASLSVFQHGEGVGVYAAVANVTLDELLTGAADDPEEGLLRGFTVRTEKGALVVDWSTAVGVQITEGSIVNVFMAASCNPFLSYADVTDGSTSVTFPAIPGEELSVWIAVSRQELTEPVYPAYSNELIQVKVPEAAPIALHGMKNLRCGVTVAEPGLEGEAADFLPQQPLTREALSDESRAVYFQTEDTYEVDNEDSGHSLLLLLRTPEGYAFFEESSYIFMPELGGSDLWISDITGLFRSYERYAGDEPWPAGDYALIFCVDGCEVARVPFTLD